MSIVATGISKAFGPTVALDQVDFSVKPGEVHALVGENGSGKSTLMRIIHGEIQPDAGEMTLEGQPYRPANPRAAMDSGVTLIHQELAVSNHLTVWENVFLGVEIRRFGILDKAAMRAKAQECLHKLNHSEISVNELTGNLAPAQKQIVEIARALRAESKVVLFDEPTSSLGHHDVESLFETIKSLRNQGYAVVYISHFLDEIKQICDRATVLRDGKIIGTVDVAETKTSQIAAMMAGRELDKVYHRTPREPGEVVLTATNVSGKKLPKELSVDLHKGEILGIAGLNGAGRTEFARCLFGLDPTTSGTIAYNDHPISPKPARNWRDGIGLVSEDRKGEGLALNLTLSDNLTMPKPGKILTSRKNEEARTQTVIEQLNVKCQGPDQRIQSLSGGNQQKIAIGRLLDTESDVLILDEPTRGIDIRSKSEIYQIIDRLANEGKAVILISSHLPELIGLCDRIIVIRRGELVDTVDPHATDEKQLMELCAGA